MRTLMMGSALVLTALLGGPHAVLAQNAQNSPDRAKLHRRAPLRVEVTPSRLYRQCTDWLVVEHRATGDTIVPRMQCRWAVQ
jgi:hypothetical protein